jgi:hypothetical protein
MNSRMAGVTRRDSVEIPHTERRPREPPAPERRQTTWSSWDPGTPLPAKLAASPALSVEPPKLPNQPVGSTSR